MHRTLVKEEPVSLLPAVRKPTSFSSGKKSTYAAWLSIYNCTSVTQDRHLQVKLPPSEKGVPSCQCPAANVGRKGRDRLTPEHWCGVRGTGDVHAPGRWKMSVKEKETSCVPNAVLPKSPHKWHQERALHT